MVKSVIFTPLRGKFPPRFLQYIVCQISTNLYIRAIYVNIGQIYIPETDLYILREQQTRLAPKGCALLLWLPREAYTSAYPVNENVT